MSSAFTDVVNELYHSKRLTQNLTKSRDTWSVKRDRQAVHYIVRNDRKHVLGTALHWPFYPQTDTEVAPPRKLVHRHICRDDLVSVQRLCAALGWVYWCGIQGFVLNRHKCPLIK